MQTQAGLPRTVHLRPSTSVPVARTAAENVLAEPNVVFNTSPLGTPLAPPDALMVQADCAICSQKIIRSFRCDGAYLIIEPWKHMVGAGHPAVPRELVED